MIVARIHHHLDRVARGVGPCSIRVEEKRGVFHPRGKKEEEVR